jgi:hypothetical protein
MQYNIMYATMDMGRDDFYGYEIVVGRLLLVCGVSLCGEMAKKVLLEESPEGHASCYRGRRRKTIVRIVNGSLVMDYTLRYCSSV